MRTKALSKNYAGTEREARQPFGVCGRGVASQEERPGPGSWVLLRTAGPQAQAVSISLDRGPLGQVASPGPALMTHQEKHQV